MQSVGIPASRHDTPCKLVYDKDFVVFYHIVFIPKHQVVGPQGQDDVVLYLQVLRVRQVLYMEEILHLLDSGLRQVDHLVLFIDHVVPGLGDILAHDGVHLGKFPGSLPPLQLSGQNIADLVQLGGLAALTGDNEGCPGLVDENRIHLVDDGVIQVPQNHLFLIDGHIVAEVVKPQFIVGHIGDIAGIGLLPLLGGHSV